MVKFPNSMDEVVYFTRRAIGENGKVVCWAYKQNCPKCKKAMMGKPKDDKGKIKIRAKEYKCPSCSYTVEKKEYEDGLTAEAQYTCPSCKFSGEIGFPYKRKKIEGIDTLRFQCQKCKGNIDITKKMKKKGSKEDGEAEDDE